MNQATHEAPDLPSHPKTLRVLTKNKPFGSSPVVMGLCLNVLLRVRATIPDALRCHCPMEENAEALTVLECRKSNHSLLIATVHDYCQLTKRWPHRAPTPLITLIAALKTAATMYKARRFRLYTSRRIRQHQELYPAAL